MPRTGPRIRLTNNWTGSPLSRISSLLSRAAASVTALGVAAAGAIVLASPAEAVKKKETPFAYQGSAYGTRVTLGTEQGSLSSGRTAWSILGCTKLAPVVHDQNGQVGKVNANEQIHVGAVTSQTTSYRDPKAALFGSKSTNKIVDVILGDPQGPHLKIGALHTIADAFSKEGKLGAKTNITWTDLGIFVAPEDQPQTGTPLDQLIDAINNEADKAAMQILMQAGVIEIPQVGTLTFGWKKTPVREKQGHAIANAYALRIDLANGSTVKLGRAWAKISKDVPAGVLTGYANATEAFALNDMVKSGRIAQQPLQCRGTDGKEISNPAARFHIAGAIDVRGANATVSGDQKKNGTAWVRNYSDVAYINLGDGQLVIEAIKAQGNIRQNKRGRIVRIDNNGTTIGSITSDGEPQAIPDPGQALEIPGVARIEAAVTDARKRVIHVTGVRITLLDGTGAVINLANVKAKINRR